VKLSNFRNIKSIIFSTSALGILYVVLLCMALSVFVNNYINYNSYERKFNTQIFELVNLKEQNRKLLNNKLRNSILVNNKSDSLYFIIKKSILNIIDIKKNSLTKTLYLEKKINLLLLDYKHLQKQYNLYFEYILQLGNSNNGQYANLLHAADEFSNRLKNLEDNNKIISHYKQIKSMLLLFQSNSNELNLKIIKTEINKIELLLDKKNKNNNNYNYLRVYDSFKTFQNTFNVYVKKKMQIGISNNNGLIHKLYKNFNIIENRLNEASDKIYKEKTQDTLLFIFVFIFLSILFLIANFLLNRNFFIKQLFFINYIKKSIENFNTGRFKKHKEIYLPHDLKEIIIELNKFSGKIQKTEKTLLAIPDRNINFDITDTERIQYLDKSLLKIWKNFELSDNDLQSEKEKRIISDWIKTGLEKFTSILRKDFTNVNIISKELLNNIIEHLNIAVGAIYLAKNKNETKLNMVANFAFGKESHIQKQIEKGEGIIGTAAIEKKTLNITNIPPDYYEINSGFGSAMPKNLLIVPVKFENDFYGIIELASFRYIKAYELEFIEELGRAFAASLSANEAHEKVRIDYDKIKKTNKKRENEIIELEKKIIKFQFDYNKINNKNSENEIIINNISNNTILFDLNIEGYVLSASNQFYQTYKIPTENINTTNYLDIIYKSEKNDEIDVDKFWNELKLGYSKKIFHRIKIGEQKFWLSENYVPVKNEDGSINKIKVISTNISDYKELEKIIETANQNIQELRLSNENNDVFIKKIKSELIEAKKETDEIKKRESELKEIIENLKK